MDTLLAAAALFFVFEGVMPFVAPGLWRETLQRLGRLTDGQLRFVGLSSIVAGLLMFAWAQA